MALVEMTRSNIFVILIGYTISIFGARAIIEPIISKLWREYLPKEYERFSKLVAYVSYVESFLYTTTVLIGQTEFIAVWLVIKLAGQWTPTKTKADRPLFHLFLLGNGLNLIISGGIGFIILYLTNI